MKRIMLLIAVFLGWMFAVSNMSFAALSDVNTTPGVDDVREINNATPGTSKTFLGTRLQGPLTIGATTFGATDNVSLPSCGGASNQTPFVTPTTKAFLITTGSTKGQSYCLGNGKANQELNLIGVSISGGTVVFSVTPQTKTGFAKVVVDTTNDAVTLEYQNDTVGWTVKGNAGATIS